MESGGAAGEVRWSSRWSQVKQQVESGEAAGGLDKPLPLHTRWFGTALNVADPPREHANGGVVCRGRV